jgi:hypothetical protein
VFSDADGPGRRRFWGTPPGILAAVAAAVTVVVFGVAMLQGRDGGPEGPSAAELIDVSSYQQRLRPICERERAQQLRVEREAERLRARQGAVRQQVQVGDVSGLTRYLDANVALAEDAVDGQAALKGELESLDPPADLAVTHQDGVAVWEQLVSYYRSASDRLATARDDFVLSGDSASLRRAPPRLDGPQQDRLSEQVDVQLQRLGGTGCDPGP